jgi:hypothetical protein
MLVAKREEGLAVFGARQRIVLGAHAKTPRRSGSHPRRRRQTEGDTRLAKTTMHQRVTSFPRARELLSPQSRRPRDHCWNWERLEFVADDIGDHKPLLYLQSQSTISDKVARWLTYPLSKIQWTMKWRAGKEMAVADALSRSDER